jgi:hypothetical protein
MTIFRKLRAKSKVREITSIQTADALIDLLGRPDAITQATPNIRGPRYTLCFDYRRGNCYHFRKKKGFPFIDVRRVRTRTRIHLLGKDRLSQLAHINKELEWGPWVYDHAVVVHAYDSFPTVKEEIEIRNLLKQSDRNIGQQIDAAPLRD